MSQALLALSAQAALLSVTRIGEGAIDPDIGVHSYAWGARVTLIATPAQGWMLDHWEGDLSGTEPTKTVQMTGHRRVTAVFRPLTVTPADALVRYVGEHDPNYQWTVTDRDQHFGWNKHTIRMQSQQWRSADEVDRPLWTHDMGIIEPWFADDTCVLLVDGGANDQGPPEEVESDLAVVAFFVGVVYAQVNQVPNQPLTFADEAGRTRREDEILGYSFDKYLETGDFRWPVLAAMTKASVRAMDTVQERLPYVRDFLVAGGSKRGWTAYLVAAVDPRVRALAPLSIDLANFAEHTRHHFETYGFYTPAVKDYVEFDLYCRVNTPRGQELLAIVDPFSYFPKYTMPKLVLNSAGDQFFPSDSSRFYYASLPGPKWLRYTVNTDHSQDQDSTAVTTALRWANNVINGHPLPQFNWSFEPDGSIRVQTSIPPRSVRLWQAHNPAARDFRLESIGPAWTSSPLAEQGGGVYVGSAPQPAQGWTAFLVELDYGGGFLLSTEVRITPDALPFAGLACP